MPRMQSLHPPAAPPSVEKAPPGVRTTVRLAAVSFLNTLPLITGLEKLEGVTLALATPSSLLDLLIQGRVDTALAPVIDFQAAPEPLALVPAGMIGSDGPTLTVRLYSRVPFERVREVAGDLDSHTSVALARIVLRRAYGASARIVPFDARAAGASPALWPETALVIGDKVVTSPPPAGLYPHELDLGEAWKKLTGLPFVYAVWMCRASDAHSPAIRLGAAVLDRQLRHNATRAGAIARAGAAARGWPVGAAESYLGAMLRYRVGDRERAAVELFFDALREEGVVPERRPTVWAF